MQARRTSCSRDCTELRRAAAEARLPGAAGRTALGLGLGLGIGLGIGIGLGLGLGLGLGIGIGIGIGLPGASRRYARSRWSVHRLGCVSAS